MTLALELVWSALVKGIRRLHRDNETAMMVSAAFLTSAYLATVLTFA